MKISKTIVTHKKTKVGINLVKTCKYCMIKKIKCIACQILNKILSNSLAQGQLNFACPTLENSVLVLSFLFCFSFD